MEAQRPTITQLSPNICFLQDQSWRNSPVLRRKEAKRQMRDRGSWDDIPRISPCSFELKKSLVVFTPLELPQYIQSTQFTSSLRTRANIQNKFLCKEGLQILRNMKIYLPLPIQFYIPWLFANGICELLHFYPFFLNKLTYFYHAKYKLLHVHRTKSRESSFPFRKQKET